MSWKFSSKLHQIDFEQIYPGEDEAVKQLAQYVIKLVNFAAMRWDHGELYLVA